jgi:hypothetical protein
MNNILSCTYNVIIHSKRQKRIAHLSKVLTELLIHSLSTPPFVWGRGTNLKSADTMWLNQMHCLQKGQCLASG